MAINRRQFIKRSAGAVSVGLVMPRFWMGGLAQGQEIAAATRRIFLVIQLGGGSDGLNTVMSEMKSLYDGGKAAIVLGAGYPNQNLSHFFATDIWSTANTSGAGNGWLGRYADQKLVGKSGLSAVNIGGSLPKAFFADK